MKNEGYTLIEMLLVLLIVSFLIGMPVVGSRDWRYRMQTAFFLTEFEKEIHLSQQLAITSGQDKSISVDQEQQSICFSFSEETLLEIPAFIQVKNKTAFSFKGNSGNANRVTKIILYDENRKMKYTYQFQLGSGRYEKKIHEG